MVSFVKVSIYGTTHYTAELNVVIDRCSFFQVAGLFK